MDVPFPYQLCRRYVKFLSKSVLKFERQNLESAEIQFDSQPIIGHPLIMNGSSSSDFFISYLKVSPVLEKVSNFTDPKFLNIGQQQRNLSRGKQQFRTSAFENIRYSPILRYYTISAILHIHVRRIFNRGIPSAPT